MRSPCGVSVPRSLITTNSLKKSGETLVCSCLMIWFRPAAGRRRAGRDLGENLAAFWASTKPHGGVICWGGSWYWLIAPGSCSNGPDRSSWPFRTEAWSSNRQTLSPKPETPNRPNPNLWMVKPCSPTGWMRGRWTTAAWQAPLLPGHGALRRTPRPIRVGT